MAEARAAGGWAKAVRRFDPFWPVWRLLTSVRFAVILITFLAIVGTLGVVIPQIPIPMRDNPAAVAAWVEFQRGKFGPFTDIMYRLGLFNVFAARWFLAGLALLVVAVGVCVINRFPPIWRTIQRPPKRVAESYLRRARHHAEFTTPADASAVERVLRRQHYKVQRFVEGEAVYLFADRFQWAQLGTFASHLAIIMFIAGGLVSLMTGYETQLLIGEGRSAPVFPVQHPNQMQVYVEDTIGRFNEQGQPLDYRTHLVIYQGGQEVKRCTTTVNDPCSYGGYRFHQAAYYAFGAEVQVRDLTADRVIFKEVLSLIDTMPAPRVVVREAGGDGRVLLDETLMLDTFLEGAYLTSVTVPETGRTFFMGVRPNEVQQRWELIVFEMGDLEGGARILLAPGEEAVANGLRFQFASIGSVPALFNQEMPLPPSVVQSEGSAGSENVGIAQGQVLLQMGNAIYGSGEASSGLNIDVPQSSGPPLLTIVGLSPYVVTLEPGSTVVIGDYEYAFLGQREFSGIQVKRDRGDLLIWVASGLLVTGLVVTFWVPRRRLWAKITPERTYMAGIAGHFVDYTRELQRLGVEAGSPDAQEREE